jgi:hypothetical protein
MWHLKHIHDTGCGDLPSSSVWRRADWCMLTDTSHEPTASTRRVNKVIIRKLYGAERFFSLPQILQTLSGAQTTSQSVVTGVLSWEQSGRDVTLTTPSSVEVKNEWSFNSFSPVCLNFLNPKTYCTWVPAAVFFKIKTKFDAHSLLRHTSCKKIAGSLKHNLTKTHGT